MNQSDEHKRDDVTGKWRVPQQRGKKERQNILTNRQGGKPNGVGQDKAFKFPDCFTLEQNNV